LAEVFSQHLVEPVNFSASGPISSNAQIRSRRSGAELRLGKGRFPSAESGFYGVPTNVVTLWAGSEAEKLASDTVTAVIAVKLEVAEVSQGVISVGQADPARKMGTVVGAEFALTMAI
jgi:hypothetical protein